MTSRSLTLSPDRGGQPVPRVTPWDQAAEEAVLGAMMLDDGAVRACLPLLAPEDFYAGSSRALFAAIAAVHAAGQAVDPITVGAELETEGALGTTVQRDWIGWLMDAVPTAANATYHAERVRKLAAQRRLASMLSGLAHDALMPGADAAAIAAEAVQALVPEAVSARRSPGFVPVRHLLYDAMEAIEARAKGESTDLVTLGLPELDHDPVGGAEVGDLVTLLMVSGHGKTALQLSMMRWAAEAGVTCGFVSAEMASRQLVNRMLSGYSGIPYGRLRSGNLYGTENGKLVNACGRLAALPIHIDDTSVPRLEDVAVRVRALKAAHPALRLVFVDYAQLLQTGGDGRKDDIRALQLEAIANGLKGLAKEIGLVVVQSAQPDGKSVDRRGADAKMPELADVAWGQALRNASDLVVCGYRPGKYDPSREDDGIFCGVRKSRASGDYDFTLRWHGPTMLAWSPRQPAPWLMAAA